MDKIFMNDYNRMVDSILKCFELDKSYNISIVTDAETSSYLIQCINAYEDAYLNSFCKEYNVSKVEIDSNFDEDEICIITIDTCLDMSRILYVENCEYYDENIKKLKSIDTDVLILDTSHIDKRIEDYYKKDIYEKSYHPIPSMANKIINCSEFEISDLIEELESGDVDGFE